MTRTAGTFYHGSGEGMSVKKMTLTAIEAMEAKAREEMAEHESRVKKGEAGKTVDVDDLLKVEDEKPEDDYASKTLTEANLDTLPAADKAFPDVTIAGTSKKAPTR